MIKFDWDKTHITKEEIIVGDGVHYGKIDDDTMGLVYFRYLVKDDEYEEIRVIDDKYNKSIIYKSWETATSYSFDRIMASDKNTYKITEAEFLEHFNSAMNFIPKLNNL